MSLIGPFFAMYIKKRSLRAGFEPAREDPIGFQVQRLNHSAIAAMTRTDAFVA